MLAVSAASDASAVSLDTVVVSSTALSRNMAELSAMTAEGAASFGTLAGAEDVTGASPDALNAQVAAMRTRFAEVSAQADIEGASMLRSAEASRVSAEMHTKFGAALQSVGNVAKGVIETLGKVALVTGVIATVIGIVASKAAAEFQQNLLKLYTTAGEAKSALAGVGKGILDMSIQVGTGANELLKAMYYVESAGFHGAAGLNVLKIAAEGAKAENSQLIPVAHALTGVLVTYASTGLTAAQAMNVLIGSVSQGSTTLNDLSSAMSNVLPAGSKFHLQLIDLTTAIATMTNQNDDASSAATHLRQVILALESPAKAGAKALAEIGLSSDALHKAMSQSLPGAIQLIIDLLGKKFPEGSAAYNDALKAISGGNKQLMGLLELSGTSLDKWKQAVKAVTGDVKAGGSAVMGWADVQKNFNFQMDAAKAAVESAAIAIGTKLLPYLTPLLGLVAPLVSQFADWATSSQGLAGFITHITDAITKVFGPAKNANSAMAPLTDTFDRAKGVIKAVGTFLSPLADTFDRASGSMKTLKSNAQPMLDTFDRAKGVFKQVHEAINPLVPILQWLHDAFLKVRDAVVAVYTFLVPIAQFIAKTLTPYIQQLGFIINTVLVPAWQAFVKAIQPYLPVLLLLAKVVGVIMVAALILVSATLLLVVGAVLLVIGIFTALVAAILFASTWIHDKISWLVNTVVGFFKWLYQQLVGGSIIPQLINSIVSWFAQLPGRVLSAIASLASRLAGFFGGLASSAFNWGLHIIQNIPSGILAGISAAIAAAQAIADAVKRILGHSKPTEGPLKDDDLWGAHFVDNFVKGILAGAPRVQSALAQMLGSAGLPGGGLNLGISGSFSGPSGIASSFGGSPVIHVHVHNEGAPVYLDGRQLAEGIGPHLVRSIAVQTGWRRPT